MSLVAFLDASVLYPATIRSVLMYFAANGAYRALWSDQVQEEWMAALTRNRPDLAHAAIARIRALMEAHVEDARVSGYESLIADVSLPDPDDRHVLAAAIHGGACVIVTANIRHFPRRILSTYGMEARRPDRFVHDLLRTKSGLVVEALATDRRRMRRPAKSIDEYLELLAATGLRKTATALRMHCREL